MLKLAKALRLTRKSRLALVGAGGKSSALFLAARQLDPPVLLTATTHLALAQAAQADRWIIAQSPQDIQRDDLGVASQVVLYTGADDGSGRTLGVSDAALEEIRRYADDLNCPLLIEADGSRRLPLKAPAAHEPPIPAFCNEVVVVAGLSGLGKPLNSTWVHRPEKFAELSGLRLGDPITLDALAQVLAHPQGGLKNIPSQARRRLLLNQADTPELQAQGSLLAQRLSQHFAAIILAQLDDRLESPQSWAGEGRNGEVFAVHERIAGIILAAGGSVRFGQPKLLLPWKGETIIRHVARNALAAGLEPVVVVAGEQMPEIRRELSGLDVVLALNPNWEEGQSTSVQAGLRALGKDVGGAIFFLGDQPQIPSRLAQTLVEAHAVSLAPIIAPLVDGQRGNPVLFDRDTFDELMLLRGDVGGRSLFSRHPIAWVPWHDPSVLLDIDTPEDYRRLLADAG